MKIKFVWPERASSIITSHFAHDKIVLVRHFGYAIWHDVIGRVMKFVFLEKYKLTAPKLRSLS